MFHERKGLKIHIIMMRQELTRKAERVHLEYRIVVLYPATRNDHVNTAQRLLT